MKKILIFLATIFSLILPEFVLARDVANITDWYIDDFKSEIIVNKDSSLTITEEIVADCGNLPDKHGIFRIVPTFYQRATNERVNTPVKLLSITGPEGQSMNYSTTKNSDSITWKIGDPNKTVTGKNTYIIRYQVQNAIRFADSGNFDELYWNLNGNFWEIQTDKFVADIKFPSEISKSNVNEINLYSGTFGAKDVGLANYQWKDSNTLEIRSTRTLLAKEGITLSATFPKDIITPYKPSFFATYGFFILFLLPVITFILCFRYWSKFGRDPKLNNPEMAQYEPPEKMTPLEVGILISNGRIDNKFLSATIIDLAVRKFITIEEIPKKGIFGKKDFQINKLTKPASETLTEAENRLYDRLFQEGDSVLISSLKMKFYTVIPTINTAVMEKFYQEQIFDKKAQSKMTYMFIAGFPLLFIGGWLMSLEWRLGLNLILCGIIIIIFAFLMPRRTNKGADLLWKAQGFRLFIKMTEKYRQQFNEKENIFEKFLPYAMIFGLVSVWIKNMKAIYGEEYFTNYHPYWYTGYALASFDVNSFDSMINDLSNNMSETLASSPSSSGSGGGGFSGGGGGGGGGGGW